MDNSGRKSIINTKVLLLYLLMPVVISAFSPIINNFIFSYIFLGILITISLWNNHFYINKGVLVGYLILSLCILFNIFISDIKQYVVPDGINLLVYSFVPIYLTSLKQINLKYFVDKSLHYAGILVLTLPYFYYLRIIGYISYFDLGLICHFIILLVLINLVIKRSNVPTSYIMMGLAIIIGLIYGSRTVILAGVACYIVSLFFYSGKNKLQYNLFVISILGVFLIIITNIKSIVRLLAFQLASVGINSRNIVLLANMLESGSIDTVSSGRENIYPIVIEYIRNNPLFPSGFGVSRFLTNGTYYHSHNFLLEIFLILGVPLGIFFLLWILTRIFRLYYQNNEIVFKIVIIFSISYFVRGIFGTHLISDQIFLLVLGLLISSGLYEKQKKLEEEYN